MLPIKPLTFKINLLMKEQIDETTFIKMRESYNEAVKEK